eukprot:5708591-Ditylum_brightwellii.AAC.2
MIGHCHDKKEGNDGLMLCTHTTSQPLIQYDDNMIGCYHDEKEGDYGLVQCAHTASQYPI